MRHRHRPAVAALSAALALLTGCASFSPDAGMDVVAEIVARDLDKNVIAVRTTEDAAAAQAAVQRLLRQPLTANAAVQVALLNNRGLQAAFNELAASEARRVGASLPPSPTFALTRLSGPAEVEIERQIIGSILALATLPARSDLAAARFRQAQLRAAEETLAVAARTRQAYYRAIAGREVVAFLAQAQTAAEAATRLAARLGETGAMNKLDQAREQVFYAELTAQLASARQRTSSDREALIRSMGVWGDDLGFKLPAALPRLPRRAHALPAVEAEAVRRRIDLQISRMELDRLARSFGLTQATRFVNILEAGYTDKVIKDKATGERSRERGFEIELQVPLFDFGEARVREAEATYMQAVNRHAELAINVRSEARDAYRVYRSAYDIAGHYEREVLPLRKIISDETLLRYNAMQIDVFSVLAEARQRIAATTAAIEARRDFWLSAADLDAAIIGGRARRPATSERTATAAAPGAPAGH